MAGCNRQPIQVLQTCGNSHMTKKQISDRIKTEGRLIQPEASIAPPAILTAAQKKEFVRLSTALVELGIFTALDVDTLTRYIIASTQYEQIVKALRKQDVLSPYYITMKKLKKTV